MIDFGIERNLFLTQYFEQRPLFRPSAFDPTPYDWSLVDRALDLQDTSREMLKVVSRQRVEPEFYVEEFVDIGLKRRRIRKDRLYGLMASGATVVLNRIELVSPQAREICLTLGRYLGALTAANAYASFGGEPATDIHWDGHDVVVVQLFGAKHWQLFEPTLELPLHSQESEGREGEAPDTPVLDVTMRAGDVLYVPRGWWHRVSPIDDQETLHLAVGVHTPLVLDYLLWLCASTLPKDITCRRSLLGRQTDATTLEAAAKVVIDAMRSPETLEAFHQRARERDRVTSSFNIEGLLGRSREALDPLSVVALNSRQVEPWDGSLPVNGQPVTFRGDYRTIVDALTASPTVKVADIGATIGKVSKPDLDRMLRELALADVIRFVN